MKKIAKTLLLVIVCCNAALAQNRTSNNHFSNSKNRSNPSQEMNTTVYKPYKEVAYYWDSTNVNWVFNDSIRTTYNLIANPVSTALYSGSGSMYRDTSLYNNSNKLVSKTQYYFNGLSWDTTYTENYTYTTSNQILTDAYLYYNSGTINGGDFTTNIYDNNNLLITSTYQNFDNGMWVNSSQSHYLYNANDVLDKLIDYQWDSTNSVWEKTDSVINLTFQFWNGSLEESRPASYIAIDMNGGQSLDSIFYDAMNNQIKYVDYLQQGNSWVFSNMQTDEYMYNNNNSIIEQIEFIYHSGATLPNDGYKVVYSDFNTYSIPTTTGISNSTSESTLTLFPNPNNGVFKLSGSLTQMLKIEIYNLLGDKIATIDKSDLPDSKEINLSAAPKGLYFVKLYETEKVQTKKIVVQ
jgi:hypothetical protein